LLPVKPNLYSQIYRFTFSNTPLSDALVSISSQLEVKVAFDSKKLGAITVNREITGNSPDEIISGPSKNTGLAFKLSINGT
jgi:hypothetical protein